MCSSDLGRTERLHLFDEERYERVRVQQGFRFLIQVSLIRRASSFGDTEEMIFHPFGGFDIDLRGQVAFRIHLVVHSEGSILRVAEVFFRIRLEHAFRERFLVAKACPYLLSFLAVDDGCSRILTKREFSLHRKSVV